MCDMRNPISLSERSFTQHFDDFMSSFSSENRMKFDNLIYIPCYIYLYTILLSKMRCKDYYSLFQVKWETQPTFVQSCSKHYPPFANKWNNLFKNISKMSADNKLRQFSFKLLHRILVTKKELKRYKIKPDDECFFCKSPDSHEHTFLACSVAKDFYYKMMVWFNSEQKSQIND